MQERIEEHQKNCNSLAPLLPTAMVRISIDGCRFGPVRALLDTGADVSILSYSLYQKYKFPTVHIHRKMTGILKEVVDIEKSVNAVICPWFESHIKIQTSFYVLPKGCHWHPTLPSKFIKQPKDLLTSKLADPEYWIPKEVDVLLGVKFLAEILVGTVSRRMEKAVLLDTALGTVVLGSESEEAINENMKNVYTIETAGDEELNKLLTRLWEIDQVGSASNWTEEQEKVEKNFMETYSRDSTGRFTVTIPLKENIENFGSSREIAKRRFFWMEKRLQSDPENKQKYIDFMRDYESLGHMQVVTEFPKEGELVYYIPHHCVTKKFRVVFDGGCRTNGGVSLNDIQLLGKKTQRNLQEIIMRFRRHSVAFVADVKMMFRQVKIHQPQWNLQRIFWRENSTEPLKEYWLTVVTYGLTSSAYNATRALVQCAREAKDNFPEAASRIENDVYMDDCTTGGNSKEEAIELAKEVDTVLKGGGFVLRKWKSNCKELMQEMCTEEDSHTFNVEEDKATILGLKWVIKEDKFTFIVKTPRLEGEITKRKIVSCVAQLYDPNGYLAPVVIKGKIFIQQLWRLSLNWDGRVPADIENEWNKFWEDIILLEQFKMSRWLGTNHESKIELHGFSDASTVAYGAVIYVRVTDQSGNITTNLLVSKTRVAPIKTISIPRLELAAAELLSRLLTNVRSAMEWEDASYILWTDSTVALQWMKKLPCNLKTYVANRVSSIQTNCDVNRWRHVGTNDNPADLLSRGLNPKDLVKNNLWLHGPAWLSLPRQKWPRNHVNETRREEMGCELKIFTITEQHKKSLQITLKKNKGRVDLINYTSTLQKFLNIMSYILRFIRNIKEAVNKGGGKAIRRSIRQRGSVPQLTAEEKAEAMCKIIQVEQEKYYFKDMTSIKLNGQTFEGSKVEPLKPFIGKHGIMRVGGRLREAQLSYEQKHQAIIPNGSRLAYLLIQHAHAETKHGAAQLMTQYIRKFYWIPKIRNEIRRYLRQCVVCVRYNYRLENQLMADLPGDRVRIGKTFLCTGVDYAGPFEMKILDGKNNTVAKQKCWAAVFVCLRTRAIHLDLVTNQSSAAFIQCYQRFIGRRGRCERMYSDNGGAFVGARNEIGKKLDFGESKEFIDYINKKGTEWKFMIPAAPHQGGIYEAAVKSMKYHLKRIVGTHTLTYEQYLTLLVEIEAILNSRPLYPLTDDPNDIQALTPGHFLIGEPLVLPPAINFENVPPHKEIRLWKEKQRMSKCFWERWKEEFLTTLQERKKWRREKENIAVGQLVLLKAENFPPAQWALARVVELIISKDGKVRSAIVKTETSCLTRPLTKICILPQKPCEENLQSTLE